MRFRMACPTARNARARRTGGMPRSTPAATCTARSRSSPASTEPLRTGGTPRLHPHLHPQVYADFHNNTASNFLISPALHTRSKLGGRWLGQAVNAHRQLPAGAVPFFLPLLRCLHGQNH